MSHFKRRSKAGHATRDRSSTWVYPKVSKGTSERSRFGAARRVQAALMAMLEYTR